MSNFGKNVLTNIDNIKVSSNEYLVKYTFWRNYRKLLENDVNLESLYREISNRIDMDMYVKGGKYDFGALVWYLPLSKDKIVILRSIYDNNRNFPEQTNRDGSHRSYEQNGWEVLSIDTDIYSTDVFDKINRVVYQAIKDHQDGEHPFGEITLDNMDDKFMRTDMSNANTRREQFFFPYVTGFLPARENDNVILNGAYRYYDNGLLEYDIVYRFGYVGQIDVGGTSFNALTCNNVEFLNEYENNRYFYNSDSYKIFCPPPNSKNDRSSIDNTLNMNRNDFVNTYFAKIDFPIPFIDSKYLIFSGDVASQVLDYQNKTVHTGRNEVTFCRKAPNSVTAILVTYPEDENKMNEEGYNATHGGLAANSFRCKIVGRANPRDE